MNACIGDLWDMFTELGLNKNFFRDIHTRSVNMNASSWQWSVPLANAYPIALLILQYIQTSINFTPPRLFYFQNAQLQETNISFDISVRMQKPNSNCTNFHENRYSIIFRKSVEKITFQLKSDNNIVKSEMGESCSAYGGQERRIQGFDGET